MITPQHIVVSTFCQTPSLAEALQVTMPHGTFYTVASKTLKGAAEVLKKADTWINCETGLPEAILAQHRAMFSGRYLRVPLLQFDAFHPDMSDAINTRTGVSSRQKYNSKIGVCAFRRGLSPAGGARLFRKDVFGRLGYFDYWDDSVLELKSRFDASDLAGDFETFYRKVKRTGLFMHTPSHPTALALSILAKLIARRLGAQVDLDQQINTQDFLIKLRWPTYPEIAEALAVPTTGYLWKISQSSLPEEVTLGSVEDFLAYCYRHYQLQGISPRDIGMSDGTTVVVDHLIGS